MHFIPVFPYNSFVCNKTRKPLTNAALCKENVRQMRGEEFLRSVGSLKRSELQVGSSICKLLEK